jgi:epoxyqueuosine reductase QueG
LVRERIGQYGRTDSPCDRDCGNCTVCSEICPIGAITESGYDVGRCMQIVRDDEGNYKTFCGLCMKACPQGKANNPMHTDAEKPNRLSKCSAITV